VQAIAYNEVATLLVAAGLFSATWRAPNRVALWTFLVLWSMRLSAKLNLFLGVPNWGEKLLPAHLRYLKSFFTKRSMNLLFPLSVSGATIVLVLLAQKYQGTGDAAQGVGYALVGSLLALAVLEHWFMVVPLPTEKLWDWALGRTSSRSAHFQDDRFQAAQAPQQLVEIAFVSLPQFAEPSRGGSDQPEAGPLERHPRLVNHAGDVGRRDVISRQ
jgi:hypothetical protein